MQPGVISDAATIGQRLAKPVGRLGFRPRHRCERAKVHLRLDLSAIPPVNEHASDVPQDHAKTCRTGEACQPRQPFVMCGHVFALMGIGTWHQKTVQRLGLHHVAQRGEPWWPLFGAGGDGKTLIHADLRSVWKPQCANLRRAWPDANRPIASRQE